jgi:hypothetical protein
MMFDGNTLLERGGVVERARNLELAQMQVGLLAFS